jgi:hypothetical protein
VSSKRLLETKRNLYEQQLSGSAERERMAGASLLQVTDIKRLFSPGCHQKLQESNFSPHLEFLTFSRGSCEQSGRQSSGRSSIVSSIGLRPAARTANNFWASCRIEQQKASKVSMAAGPSPADSTSDNVDSHMGTRRTALLVGSSLLLSSLTTLIAGSREAQAAVSKPPYVEEVPEFVKGELRRLL